MSTDSSLASINAIAEPASIACSTQSNVAFLDQVPSNTRELLLAGAKLDALPRDSGAQFKLTAPEGNLIRVSAKDAVCSVALVDPPKSAVKSPAKKDAEDAAKADAVYKPADEWSVPASPGFDIIGATPNLANLPKTPRELAMHLVGGRAADGTIQKGLAVDASLAQLLKAIPFLDPDVLDSIIGPKASNSSTLLAKSLSALPKVLLPDDAVLENRLADRIHLSFATTQEENKTGAPVNLGFGLQYTLWDYSDRKTSCKELKPVASDPKGTKNKICPQATKTEAAALTPQEIAKQEFFGGAAAAVGFARAYLLKEGRWGDRMASTKGRWATVATPGFNLLASPSAEPPRFQFIGHYRRFDDQPVNAGTEAAPVARIQDTSTTALRMKIGRPAGSASFEFARSNKKIDGEAPTRTSRRALGLEWRVAKDIWLVASGGREWSPLGVIKNQPFVVTSLRFGDKSIPLRNGE